MCRKVEFVSSGIVFVFNDFVVIVYINGLVVIIIG